jgi:hypothetical protein
MLAYLGSREFIEKLFRQSRMFPEYLDPTYNSPLLTLLRNGPTPAATFGEHTTFLLKCGYVAITADGLLELAAPLVRQFLLLRIFMPDSSFALDGPPPTMSHSLEAAIQRLDLSTLRNTRSTDLSGKRISEAQWQEAFCTAYRLSLPYTYFISPEFGHQVGLDAKLDILVTGPGCCWGIELVCEGLRLSEHVQRFTAEDGEYRDMTDEKIIQDWVVLDFRHTKPRELLDHVWYLQFSDDNSSVELLRKGKPSRHFDLVGSDVGLARQTSALSLQPPVTPSRPK